MSEAAVGAAEGRAEAAPGCPPPTSTPAAQLLQSAVDALLAEVPVELPGPQALDRLQIMLTNLERLRAAQLLAIRDLDARELYALDAAGSARTWLRRHPGGDAGQVTLARRLAHRPHLTTALTDARLSVPTAAQLCTALEHLPDTLDEPVVLAVVQDGIAPLLLAATGGTPEPDGPDGGAARDAVLAQRAADQTVLDAVCTDTRNPPDRRLEPAFVLLAERLSPADLPGALRSLLDPLQPDGSDGNDDTDPYYLELRTLLDGDVDLRGHLDPETGQNLAAEIERRLTNANHAARQARQAAATAEAQAAAETAADVTADADADDLDGHDDHDDHDDHDVEDLDDLDGDAAQDWDDALASFEPDQTVPGEQHQDERGQAHRTQNDTEQDEQPPHDEPADPQRPVSLGRRRHDALRDLLTDAATAAPGEPAPASLTILTTLDAIEGRLGALPAQLVLPDGRTTALPPDTLQRLGCHSTLDAVLLDALGNPIGASSTRRMPNRRERRAIRARWGPRCAVHGCPRLRTVPHHVIPWWLSHLTQLRDLIPLCASCHHDIHEGHRTLRLRDGRLIDDHGWVWSVPAFVDAG